MWTMSESGGGGGLIGPDYPCPGNQNGASQNFEERAGGRGRERERERERGREGERGRERERETERKERERERGR